jgi:glycosyltransferase involved in cell wall biosynthesis
MLEKKTVEQEQNKNPEYSVVVPIYNSEITLRELHQRLAEVFKKLGSSWELILVNDYSKDNSWKIMKEIASENKNVTAINLTNNFGQHNAIMCGLAYVQGKYVITMDDDLQNPPEEIPKLIKTISEGKYSIVYGQFIKKRHGPFRDFASKSVNILLSRISGHGYTVTSFRIMEKQVVEKLVRFTQYNIMIDVAIKDIAANKSVGHCMVEHHARKVGKSGYSYRKLFAYAINMIFNFTLWPLKLATILGFIFSFFSVVLGISLLYYYFKHGVPVSGWTSLILAISFFSGIILFVLGIIGEYVGRIFLNINQKPQYFVKEIIRGESHEE